MDSTDDTTAATVATTATAPASLGHSAAAEEVVAAEVGKQEPLPARDAPTAADLSGATVPHEADGEVSKKDEQEEKEEKEPRKDPAAQAEEVIAEAEVALRAELVKEIQKELEVEEEEAVEEEKVKEHEKGLEGAEGPKKAADEVKQLEATAVDVKGTAAELTEAPGEQERGPEPAEQASAEQKEAPSASQLADEVQPAGVSMAESSSTLDTTSPRETSQPTTPEADVPKLSTGTTPETTPEQQPEKPQKEPDAKARAMTLPPPVTVDVSRGATAGESAEEIAPESPVEEPPPLTGHPLPSLNRKSTMLLPLLPLPVQLEGKAAVTLLANVRETSRDIIIKCLKENRVTGMWQQYNLFMVARGKETKLEVDEHPQALRAGLRDGKGEKDAPDVLFVVRAANIAAVPGLAGKIRLTRRHSDEAAASSMDQEKDKGKGKEKEKDKGKGKGKGKQPIGRVTSSPEDAMGERKGGYFKAKVADKHVETTLEKFGKDAKASAAAPAPLLKAKSDLKFDKKLSRTGRPESFGVDLAEQCAREGGLVPRVVLACTAAVERRGIDRVGIYRISSVQSKISRLQLELLHGNEPDLLGDESEHDVNAIAGVLKNYFRELPKAVFPPKQYQEFLAIPRLAASAKTVPEQLALKSKQLEDMRAALSKLSKPALHTIEHMVRHLKLVASHHEANKMTGDNLSLLLGPSMMGGKDNDVFEMPLQSGVLLFIMGHYNQVFTGELQCRQ